MTNLVEIKKATINDCDAVYDLICDLEKNNFDKKKFQTLYEYNVSDKNLIYLVATKDKEIVGFISVHLQGLLHHCSRVAEIQELVINENFRGQNIGQKLILEAEKICLDLGIIEIEVTSNKKNERAHKFYMNNNYLASHYKFTRKL